MRGNNVERGVCADELHQEQENWRVTLPRRWHKLFLTLLPLTWRIANNYRGTSTAERVLEHRGEAEALPVLQRPRQTAFKGKRSSCMLAHCSSPRPAQHHLERFLLNFLWLWREKEHCGSLCQSTMEIAKESVGLNHWESDCHWEGRRGWQKPAHRAWQTKFVLVVPR